MSIHSLLPRVQYLALSAAFLFLFMPTGGGFAQDAVSQVDSEVVSGFEIGDGAGQFVNGQADILGSSQSGPDWSDIFDVNGALLDVLDSDGFIGRNGVPDIYEQFPGAFKASAFAVDLRSADGVDASALRADGNVGSGLVSARHDLANAYSFSFLSENGSTMLFFGLERPDAAEPTVAFMEFNQRAVTLNQNGELVGARSLGDLRFEIQLSSRGVDAYRVDRWSEIEGAQRGFVELASFESDATSRFGGCVSEGAICLAINSSEVRRGAWKSLDRDGTEVDRLGPMTFVEVGVNLSAIGQPLAGTGALFEAFVASTAEDVLLAEFQKATNETGGVCLETRYQAAGNNQSLNCSANDVNLVDVRATIIDPCEFPGDTATVALTANIDITSNSPRHDISFYFAEDGGDALTGVCASSILENPDGANPPVSHPGLVDEDMDICRDLKDGASDPLPVPAPANPDAEVFDYVFPVVVNMLCVDTDGDGLANLSACASWKQPGGDTVCTGLEQAIPGGPSKCKCEDLNVAGLPVPKTIEVVKDLVPDDDPGRFDLHIAGTDPDDGVLEVTEQAVGDDGTTGKVEVKEGSTATIGESGALQEDGVTLTELLDYETSIQCVDEAGFCVDSVGGQVTVDGNPIQCTAATAVVCTRLDSTNSCAVGTDVVASCAVDVCTPGALDVPIPATGLSDIVCTITNERRAAIIIKKETEPALDPTEFTFEGDVLGDPVLLSDGQSHKVYVDAGTYDVTETLPSDWALTDISCSDGDSTWNLETATATFVVAEHETVECTFTNKKRGSIEIIKDARPDGDSQIFAFESDIPEQSSFALDDNGDPTHSPLNREDLGGAR